MENSTRKNKIPGTIPSTYSSQILTSTGISSLDSILKGGLPVGSVTIIEEDFQGSYARALLNYVIAEGIANQHSILLASLDSDTHKTAENLPAQIKDGDTKDSPSQIDATDLKIAFRYQNIPTHLNDELKTINHHFDLSKKIQIKVLKEAKIFHWNQDETLPDNFDQFSNKNYGNLLNFIQTKLVENDGFLRICLDSLGSPLWFGNRDFSPKNGVKDLNLFLYMLRALVKQNSAIAVVTIPSILYKNIENCRFRHSGDLLIRLEAFAGTELEQNVSLANFHGFFYVEKVAPLNSLISPHSSALEYVFQLKRHKFHIEKFSLPPDVQEIEKSELPKCYSGGELDF